MSEHTIASDRLTVTVASLGAEMQRLVHAEAGDVLWSAGPVWPRHAPVLFPIVGELAGGTYRHDGATYTMGRHGFARTTEFAWIEREATSCALRLVDDDATRAQYPFRFALTLRYAVTGERLDVTYELHNPGDVVLLASVGAHPAFAWPLPGAPSKDGHTLEFAEPEPEPIRRLADNLLSPEPRPTPVDGRVLRLDPSLYDDDAVIFDRPRSSRVRYTGPGTPTIEVAWSGFAELGNWSKTGGDFVCIEPWHGFADPVGFTGEFAEKPGLAHIPPGETATYRYGIAVTC